ncbi:hypothetical protein U1Q18_043795, partial [Sarracenia purpurea var. burkii]
AIESSEEKVSEGEEETDVYDEATEAAFERLALDALDRARQGRSPLNKEALEAVVEWLAWYRDSPPPTEKSKSSDGVFGTRDLLTNVEGKEDKQSVPVAGASLKLANNGSDSAILEISVSKAVGDGNEVVGDEEEAVVTELDPASMVGDEVICSRSTPIVFDGKKLCDVACPAKNVLIDENICPVSSISRRMRNVEYKEKQLGVKNGGSSHALQFGLDMFIHLDRGLAAKCILCTLIFRWRPGYPCLTEFLVFCSRYGFWLRSCPMVGGQEEATIKGPVFGSC